MGVDLVIDCTGVFKTAAKVAPYFAAGVRKVVVSAPVKDGGALNLVYGVNHHLYDGSQSLITAASCTTNCLAPLVKVIHESLGIRHGSITTIHDVTNTQTIVDRPAKDMRRARSALMNLIPTTTGSATAITLIYPELKGRLNGHAVRVPLLNASLTDAVFEVARPTTAEEVNALFAAAAEGPLKGILGLEMRPLVSSDFTNDPRSAIVDGPRPWSRRHPGEGLCLVRQRMGLCLPPRRHRPHGRPGAVAPGGSVLGAPVPGGSSGFLFDKYPLGVRGAKRPGPPPARKRRP